MIQLTLQMGNTLTTLATLEGRLRDLLPLMQTAHDILVASVQQNFAQGGRPAWPPRRPPRTGTPLGGTASRLAESIQASVTPTSVTLSSALPYSAIQQYGGTVQVRALVAAPHHVFRFVTAAGDVVFTRRIRAHPVTLPARPYLVAQPEDEAQLVQKTGVYLTQGLP